MFLDCLFLVHTSLINVNSYSYPTPLAGDCGEERESMSSHHTILVPFLGGKEEREKNFLDPRRSGLPAEFGWTYFLGAGEREMKVSAAALILPSFVSARTPDQLSHRIASNRIAGDELYFYFDIHSGISDGKLIVMLHQKFGELKCCMQEY